MKEVLFIRFGWPSLYRSQPDNKTPISALQKQRNIVNAMIKHNALVLTDPVRR